MDKKEKALSTLETKWVITRDYEEDYFKPYFANKNLARTYDVRNAMGFDTEEECQKWFDENYIKGNEYMERFKYQPQEVYKNTILKTIKALIPKEFEVKKYNNKEYYVRFNSRWLFDIQTNDFVENAPKVIEEVHQKVLRYSHLIGAKKQFDDFAKLMNEKYGLELNESIFFHQDKGAVIRNLDLQHKEFTIPFHEMSVEGFIKHYNNFLDKLMQDNQIEINKLTKKQSQIMAMYLR